MPAAVYLLTVDEPIGQFQDCCWAVLSNQNQRQALLPRSHADQLHQVDDNEHERVHLFSHDDNEDDGDHLFSGSTKYRQITRSTNHRQQQKQRFY